MIINPVMLFKYNSTLKKSLNLIIQFKKKNLKKILLNCYLINSIIVNSILL